MKDIILFVSLVAVFVLAAETPLDAYLDPGSGSMFLQMLLGGVVGIGVAARFFWQRLTGVFRRKEVARDER